MALEQPGFSLGIVEAGVDLSAAANQYRWVKYGSGGTAGKFILCSAAGEIGAVGIVQNKPILGQPATVAINWPLTKAVAGAAVTAGVLITTDSVGRTIAAVAGAGIYALGRAHSAAGAAGDIIMIQQFGAPVLAP